VDFLSSGLFGLIELVCLVVAGWALIDCAIRATAAFPAAGKLTKPAWLAITGGAVFVQVLFAALSLFGIAALVASIVYLVDVRPAVKEVQGGGRWS
jgi:NAD/NADP transhydrogenase alpha subunit